MNWTEAGVIVQAAGAVAIVMMMAALVRQLRASARQARLTARQQILDLLTAPATLVAGSDGLARAFHEYLDGRPLEGHQRQQLLGYCRVFLRTWQGAHDQYRNGMLSDDEWRGLRIELKKLLELSVCQDYWRDAGEFFSAPYRWEVERIIEEIHDESMDARATIKPPRPSPPSAEDVTTPSENTSSDLQQGSDAP